MTARDPDSSLSNPRPSVAPELVSELRSRFAAHRSEVEGLLGGNVELAGGAGPALALGIDELLELLVARSLPGTWTDTEPALVAVGSYGRSSLSFHSDLDVRLLGGEPAQAESIAATLLYPLWDAGVSIGHQVLSAEQWVELAQEDLPTATSLLDGRTIVGDPAKVKQLDALAFSTLFGPTKVVRFLERLAARTRERTERYGGSVYLLEPDVRNGPGGLRDFDVFHWTARARWRVPIPRDLVKIGVLISREWAPIEAAVGFLSHVRNLLHVLGGRRNDRLNFERQEQVAVRLGYGDDGPAVERFMSDYYRHARSLEQARDLLFLRAAPAPTRRPHEVSLGAGLKLINGKISFAGALESEPTLALRLYSEAVKRRVEVYPFARSQIARASSSPVFAERLRQSEEAGRLFTRLVSWIPQVPFASGSVLVELHDVGLLTAMVPEFLPVVGRVHHDVYHVYTVDAHTLKAVDRLRALCRGELSESSAIAARLAAEIARPNVLFMAMLLHDVGKDIGGLSHSERGADLAESILPRMGFSSSDRREVQHLIRQHLKMYHTATRRDLEDPRTIDEFAKEVHGEEGLRELYLLTVCDVGTTSPEALTSWKAKMLDELYLAVESRLSLSRGQIGIGEAALCIRDEVRQLWPFPDQREMLEQFLDAMPERYLFANDARKIVEHARLVLETGASGSAVRAVTVETPCAEFAVLADDCPGLLAMIAASIAAAQVEILAAQIYSFVDASGRRRALDLFWVFAGERVTTGRTLSKRFVTDLERQLSRQVTGAELVSGSRRAGRWASRVTPSVPTRIHVDNRGGTHDTIVEITTRDHLGLLFELASTLQQAGLEISLAKINTEGTQVADVFYVKEASGGKMTDPLRIEALKASIHKAVDPG